MHYKVRMGFSALLRAGGLASQGLAPPRARCGRTWPHSGSRASGVEEQTDTESEQSEKTGDNESVWEEDGAGPGGGGAIVAEIRARRRLWGERAAGHDTDGQPQPLRSVVHGEGRGLEEAPVPA